MNKRSFLLLSVLIILILSTSFLLAQNLKIGYVNSEKIKAEYVEAKDAQKKIQDINTKWEEEAVAKQKEITELQEQLESQSLLLSEEKKREKYQELQNLALKFEQYKQQKWGQQGEIFAKREEIWKPVEEKIFNVINQIGKAESFDYIFDSALNVFLYIDSKMPDLTTKIIEELNKTATTPAKK